MLKNVKLKSTGEIVRIAAGEAEAMYLRGSGDPVSNSIMRSVRAGFTEAEARKTSWPDLKKRLEAKKKPQEVKKEPEAKKEAVEDDAKKPEDKTAKPRRQKPGT